MNSINWQSQNEERQDISSNHCCNVCMKPEMSFIDRNVFSMVMELDLKDTTYVVNFNKNMDDITKKSLMSIIPTSIS